VHCFTSEPKVVRHTKTLLRTLTGGGTAPPPDLPARSASAGGGSEVTEDATAEFGAQELAGHVGTLHLGVVLRGDPRASLAAFCEAEHMDVLVISTRAGGRIRKTLSGGSVSGHLIDHAPCPALVVPYRALNIPRDEDDEPLSPRSPPGGAALGAGLGAEGGRGSGSGGVGGLASVAALQAALEGKDREIAELREEVRRLRLAAAESADVGAHAPLAAPQPY
jgi:nucleotide-binding universal stress UspA family protein